jgi:hypothetical protein
MFASNGRLFAWILVTLAVVLSAAWFTCGLAEQLP